MKIDDIKDPQIRALAWKYRKANKDENFNEDTVYAGFDWKNTKEGGNFWLDVYHEYEVEITEKIKADHPEIFLKQEEMKNEFNFKVGDKVSLPDFEDGEFVEIIALFGDLRIDDLFTGVNQDGLIFTSYRKNNNWQLYQPKPEKVKLTKFYCSDNDDDFMIKYYKTQSDAPIEWSYVYTEKEFKEKFDVEI